MALRAEEAAPPLPDDLGVRYAATFGRLKGLFRSRGLDPEESADLAQETIARTLLHLNRHGLTRPDVGPLMGRIARNLAAERARARRPALVALSGAEAVDDPTQDPHEQLARRERQLAVRRALGELNGRHRRALLLQMNGSAPAEIARVLGVERNAADALLHRARRRLAERLSGSRDRLGAFTGLVSTRLRSAGRRVADATSSLQSLGVTASQMAGGLVVAAVLGAVSLSSSPATSDAEQAADDGAAAAAVAPWGESEAAAQDAGAAPGTARETVGPVTASVDVRDRQVGVETQATNPATGEQEPVLLDIWHERDESDRGLLGPFLDSGTDEVCGRFDGACDGGTG